MSCQRLVLLQTTLLFLIQYVHISLSSTFHNKLGLEIEEARNYASSSYLTNLQPVVPIQPPMPMIPFTFDTVPKLSGLCEFNFSSAESILKVTGIDCWSSLAPYLANVVCCPQFEATMVILMGQYINSTRILSLNETHAKHCVSDVEKILQSKGAIENLHKICSISSTNLSRGSCPIFDINEVERILETSLVLDSCKKIDEASECCNQVCHNVISTATAKLALRKKKNITQTQEEVEQTLNDCKKIVVTWLASKLEPSSTNRILRLLSSCNINKACPLAFPDIKNVLKECGNSITTQTSCCDSLKSYMSQLQEQSFITSNQALNCAASLGLTLLKNNVSSNIYNLCHAKLKDFSIQVDSRESGCLFPSLPSDITFDKSSGIGFICDLNDDHVEAPWPTDTRVPEYSSCNKTIVLPQLPKATSAQRGLHIGGTVLVTLFSVLLAL